MHIYIKIIGETKEPLKWEFHGNYALEQMIIRTTEVYFGKKISSRVESIIAGRL